MENPVMIFGANYIGRLVKEIFETNNNLVYGFLDDNKTLHGREIDGATILGSTDDDGYLKLIGKKCEAFIAVDDTRLRKSLVSMLNEVRHIQPVNAIHHHAFLSSSSEIGHGNLVDANVHIGAGVKMGNHCLVHSGVILAPEVVLGDYVQVGAGSIVNSGVVIENDVFIGSGVILVSGITIGKGARIGAGSVVIASVKTGDTVFGNPAQPIKS